MELLPGQGDQGGRAGDEDRPLAANLAKTADPKDRAVSWKDMPAGTGRDSSQGQRDEEASKEHLSRHEAMAPGVTMFQLAIAIGAISVLTRRKVFWLVAIAFGAVGVYFVAAGICVRLTPERRFGILRRDGLEPGHGGLKGSSMRRVSSTAEGRPGIGLAAGRGAGCAGDSNGPPTCSTTPATTSAPWPAAPRSSTASRSKTSTWKTSTSRRWSPPAAAPRRRRPRTL